MLVSEHVEVVGILVGDKKRGLSSRVQLTPES